MIDVQTATYVDVHKKSTSPRRTEWGSRSVPLAAVVQSPSLRLNARTQNKRMLTLGFRAALLHRLTPLLLSWRDFRAAQGLRRRCPGPACARAAGQRPIVAGGAALFALKRVSVLCRLRGRPPLECAITGGLCLRDF